MSLSPDIVLHQVHAGPLANCLYVLADPTTDQGYLIDPAWDPVELLRQAENAGIEIQGVLLTHTHPDHIGGEIFGQHIPGIAELRRERELDLWVHPSESRRLIEISGAPSGIVHTFEDGDRLPLGALEIEVMHTPGHSPGSCCLRIGDDLIAGDTLFVQGCGRVDLPGSDVEAMYHSLRRLAELPPQTRIYPGHDYGPTPTSTIGAELEQNMYLRVPDLERWRFLMGNA